MDIDTTPPAATPNHAPTAARSSDSPVRGANVGNLIFAWSLVAAFIAGCAALAYADEVFREALLISEFTDPEFGWYWATIGFFVVVSPLLPAALFVSGNASLATYRAVRRKPHSTSWRASWSTYGVVVATMVAVSCGWPWGFSDGLSVGETVSRFRWIDVAPVAMVASTALIGAAAGFALRARARAVDAKGE